MHAVNDISFVYVNLNTYTDILLEIYAYIYTYILNAIMDWLPFISAVYHLLV